MKRIIATIVLVAYTAAAIGFSFSVHFCGGDVEGIYLTAANESGCCGDDADTDGCCEDKVVAAKSHADHTILSKVLELRQHMVALLPVVVRTSYAATPRLLAGSAGHAAHGPSPPALRGIPLFLLFRVLRI